MRAILNVFSSKLAGYCHKRRVARALALQARGEARKDGLIALNIATHLQIEWRARKIHPWDRRLLSPEQRERAFMQQSLADTEAAIQRLFSELPDVDLISLKVLDPVLERVIISGRVSREGLADSNRKLSIGMRLAYLGLTCHWAGSVCAAPRSDFTAW